MARKISATEDEVLEELAIGSVLLLSLPEYANDAAAKTGGLTEGDLYRTATGVVMVVLAA